MKQPHEMTLDELLRFVATITMDHVHTYNVESLWSAEIEATCLPAVEVSDYESKEEALLALFWEIERQSYDHRTNDYHSCGDYTCCHMEATNEND